MRTDQDVYDDFPSLEIEPERSNLVTGILGVSAGAAITVLLTRVLLWGVVGI